MRILDRLWSSHDVLESASVLPVAAACAVAAVCSRRNRTMLFITLGMLVGSVSLGASYVARGAGATENLGATVSESFVVVEDAYTGDRGSSVVVEHSSGRLRGDRERLYLDADETAPPYGASVRLEGRRIEPNPESRIVDRRAGVAGRIRVSRIGPTRFGSDLRGTLGRFRSAATKRLLEEPGVGGPLSVSLLLGDRTHLASTGLEDSFRIAGSTHLIAISGSHLVFFGAQMQWLMGKAGFGRRAREGGVLLVMTLYVVLSGAAPSAVRALVMAASARAGGLLSRRADRPGGLAACVAVLLCVDPSNAFDLGFVLSACSVAGIAFLAELIRSWIVVAVPWRHARPTVDSAAATIAAQAATTPVTVPMFSSFSMVAPWANLVAGPIVSLCMATGTAGLALDALAPKLADPVLWATGRAAGVFAAVADTAASVPGARIMLGGSAWAWGLGSAVLFFLVWAVRPRATVRRVVVLTGLVTVLAAWTFVAPASTGDSVMFLDVGQGDAILISSGGDTLLVDTGEDPDVLSAALAREGVRSVDAVLLSHLHADHAGAVGALRGLAGFSEAYVAAGTTFTADDGGRRTLEQLEEAGTVIELVAGDVLAVGSYRVRVLWPTRPVSDPDDNASCLVVWVDGPRCDYLLTGDAEADVLRSVAGEVSHVDVLKVGHHGSKDSVDAGTLAALAPSFSVVSVGENNRFGHPARSTMSLLEDAGVRTVRTDRSGTIEFTETARGVRMRLER